MSLVLPVHHSNTLAGFGSSYSGDGLNTSFAAVYGPNEGEMFSVASALTYGRIWEDTARTIPAVVNGPVGSQRGELGRYYRTQATTANKPILRGSPAGATLIANGGFDDASAWSTGAGWAIGSGVATATTSSDPLSQGVSLIAGHVYRITHTITRTAGSLQPRFTGGTTVNGPARSAAGTYEDHLIAAAGNTTLEFLGAGFTGTADNVSIFDVSAGQVVAPYWLESDGTKWMSFTMDSVLTGELKIAGVRFFSSDAQQAVLSTWVNDSAGGQSFIDRNSNNEARYVFRVSSGNAQASAAAITPSTGVVLDGRWSADSGICGMNGVDGTPVAGTKIGNNKIVTLMAREGGILPMNGRVYCDAIYGGAVSAGELALFRQWTSSHLENPPL